MGYQTLIGFKETVDKNKSRNYIEGIIEHVQKEAWSEAVNILQYDHSFSYKEIQEMIDTKQMANLRVPHTHPSFSENEDIIRGWIGAMLDGELTLLTSYAVEYAD